MKTKQLIATITVVLVASVALASMYEAQAQEVTPFPSREKTISVTGTATTQMQPDLLHIQFGVETQELTAKQALDSNSVLMNKVINALRTSGVTQDEISTSSLNIYPVYEHYREPITETYKTELVGYKVSNVISVKTQNLDLAAAIIDGAVNAGVNRVDSVYFTLSPELHQQVKDDLLSSAVENAKSKANKALSPLDHKIIGVKEVRLSEFSIPYPEPVFRANDGFYEEAARSFAPTPVFSSEQDIATSVSVVFIIGSN